MSTFSTEAKVGIFVLIGLVLFVYMGYRIGGFDLTQQKRYEVSAIFDTASGLKVGVPVQVAGIEIGTVGSIGLAGSRARVIMLLDPGVALPLDSQAVIRTSGVLGDKYIEMVPGTEGAPILKNGDKIIQTRTPAEVDQLITRISEISDDIKRVTASLSEVFGGPEGTQDMRKVLSNLREMSDSLATIVRDNNEQINRMVSNLSDFSADLKQMSAANKGNINAIFTSFRKTSEQMGRTIASLQDITEKINQGQGSIGRLVNDDTTVKDLNGTLASLRDISDKINQGQGTLGKLINDTSTADKIDDALTGVNDYLARTDAFKFYIDYRGDYMFRYEDLKSTLNVRIQPKEDKYYLLGISTDTQGSYRKSQKTFITGGQEVTSTEETWDRGDIKFTAQIAKRYRDWVLRGGMIDSQGGFGVDWYHMNDRLKLTLEATAGEVDQNAHLRLGMTYDFLKYFYISTGYDDFLSDRGRESAYLGLGLTFDDNDLKYLLSSAPIPTK
ncbi:MAG: MCE family protein [Proteobacteria bacterium]|nr:MCE family protein [Pseudomonadota bacterium]